MVALTFWQNSISLHQAPVIRALSRIPETSVRVVVATEISEHRKKLGWTRPDYGTAEVHVAPNEHGLRQLVKATREDDAHIFSGVAAYPSLNSIRGELAGRIAGELIAMTESWDPRGPLRQARNIVAPLRLRAAARQYDRFLACGSLAKNQLKNILGSAELIVDYGYFVDSSSASHRTVQGGSGVPAIAYVAELIPRKDPATLLQALASLTDLDWTLHIVGDGPLRAKISAQVQEIGISSRVVFHGALPHPAARQVLASSHLLVLPSQYDGWGAVVNEALMDGVPAIVSSMAGAKAVIRSGLQGAVFRAGSPSELATQIRAELSTPFETVRNERLRAWSADTISPPVIAKYLLKVLSSQPAVAPWVQP